MKVIITGATGIAGSEVVRQCLSDPEIKTVTVISRRSVHFSHPKLTIIVHHDFLDYSNIIHELQDHDACI